MRIPGVLVDQYDAERLEIIARKLTVIDRQWYDDKWKRVTEKEVIESEFPLRPPTAEEAVRDKQQAQALLEEGTMVGLAEVWVRRLLRSHMYADLAIDFLAENLHTDDCLKNNYAAGTRWWCTREDVKDEYRAKARKMVEGWHEAELAAAAEVGD